MLSIPPIPYEIFALASHFHVYLPWVNICSEQCLNGVLNVNALVGTLNQEKVQVAFSVIADLCMDLRMIVKLFYWVPLLGDANGMLYYKATIYLMLGSTQRLALLPISPPIIYYDRH